MKQSKIFISYSHRGNGLAWKDRLIDALAVFEKHHLLDIWHDEEMALGENWHERIKDSMRSSRLAILLLTDEMLKSPFVLQHEFPELKRRHESEGLIIAPILCEKCDWATNEWVASLQIKSRVQTDPTPLADMSERDAGSALREIATEIAERVSRLTLAELHKPDSPLSADRVCLDKFPLTNGPGLREEKLIGREQELALLDLVFAQPQTAIATLVAWGGVGKTMLVQHWLRRLQMEEWYSASRVYAWSFYSQGTTEDRQASEDTFLAHALEWFGVQCEPTLSPWDKGRLLTDAIIKEPTLLVLDGIEPLQDPPGPMGGQLRAPGVQSLLKQLARKAGDAAYPCLCLVTTREPLTDLSDFERRPEAARGSVLRLDLGNLNDEAGARLLHRVGVKRAGAAAIKDNDAELREASREVDGHALTLNLMGRFLARAYGGDIRRRNRMKFEEADRNEQGSSTFKMLAAFENWFADSGEFGARQLAVLRILGIFDRPAGFGLIDELCRPPVIIGLTDPLIPLIEENWNLTISFLSDVGLLVILRAEQVVNGERNFLTCHPLVREYFSHQLRINNPEAWGEANYRLFNYLNIYTPDIPHPSLQDLQPLYQAITLGCNAGESSQALTDVFIKKIQKGIDPFSGSYSMKQLGAFGADLGALSCFFIEGWSKLYSSLSLPLQAFVLNQSALCLRALGRVEEALIPIQLSLNILTADSDWQSSAMIASNLCQFEQLTGNISKATDYGRIAVKYAIKSGDEHTEIGSTTSLADAMIQSGDFSLAQNLFVECEKLQSAWQPQFNLLHSVPGYRYCDFLLFKAELCAWYLYTGPAKNFPDTNERKRGILDQCLNVEERAKTLLSWEVEGRLLDIGFDYLAMGRANLYFTIVDSFTQSYLARFDRSMNYISSAQEFLRRAGTVHYLPRALTTQAWLFRLIGNASAAKEHLDEAWDIASRGPMRLHMADIHLYRARLFFREEHYPWESPQADLEAAEKLINECGYHRRDEELADAKKAILSV